MKKETLPYTYSDYGQPMIVHYQNNRNIVYVERASVLHTAFAELWIVIQYSFEMLKGQYGLKDHISILSEIFIFNNNNLNNYYLINLLKKLIKKWIIYF